MKGLLLVDLAAMPDAGYADEALPIIYDIDDSVVPNPDAPLPGSTFEFLQPGGRGFSANPSSFEKNSLNHNIGKAIQFFSSRWLEFDPIFSHEVCRA